MNQLWEATGPIIIGIVSLLGISIVLYLLTIFIPEIKRTVKAAFPFILAATLIISVYIASGIWGWTK
ncbi:hypothetical protein [Paenibacillus sp. Cedars]|uniref:hypothetical protein n=1 Tax=Paenibacillus sp. Cedars TaxID=1980674 RepID=UPI001165B134|nr:hypothetical protein [Paenibacillus sp. Cedars]AWP30752.1 hypothetical protein B9D94_30895 [Paenibacillus sp. Cedars]